ncbi:MAG: DUF3822 family protein [Prevotellaceae bacterium]|jgi:hypothetical protein|nr:DUF3822 family protein [Prevotellaceae bacterium]
MNNTDLISQTFAAENSQNYNLIIRELSDGFVFEVNEAASGQRVAIRTTSQKDFEKLQDEPLLQLVYNQAKIITKNLPFAFVPKEFFDEEQAHFYLPITKVQQKRANVEIMEIEKFGVAGIFNYREKIEIQNIISEKIVVSHPLFELLQTAESAVEKAIFVEIASQNMYIVAVDGAKLLSVNAFEVKTNEDIAYFLLLTVNQLNFDVNEVVIEIICEGNKALLTLLKKYCLITHHEINRVKL